MNTVRENALREWWRPLPAGDVSTPPATTTTRVDDGGSVAFWALLAFLGVLMLSPQSAFPALQPFRIAFLSAGAAVFAYLVHRLGARQPLVEFTPAVKYVAAIVAWAIATLPFSYWPGGSIAFLLEMYFKTLVIFLLLGHVVDSGKRLRIVASALALMTVPVALSGISNYFSGESIGSGRIFGYNSPLAANPNDLALTLNLCLPFAIALFLHTRRLLAKVCLVAVIGLMVAAIIVTFSRSGFLTLGVVAIAYGWNLVRRGRAGLVVTVFVAAMSCAPFLPGHYWDRLSTITNIEADQSGSAQERWSDSIAAVKYISTHPIVGAGIGQNILAMNEARGDHWLRVHNVYLQYGVELGLPGLALFIALLVTSIRDAGFAKRVGAYLRDSELFHLAEAVRIALLAYVLAAAFHPSGYHFYFYLPAGLALAVGAIARKRLEARS